MHQKFDRVFSTSSLDLFRSRQDSISDTNGRTFLDTRINFNVWNNFNFSEFHRLTPVIPKTVIFACDAQRSMEAPRRDGFRLEGFNKWRFAPPFQLNTRQTNVIAGTRTVWSN